MTQHAQLQGAVDNEFDGAKVIVETLKGLDKEKQERALRFASETLGLHAPAVPGGAGPPPPAGQAPVPEEKTEASPPGRVVDIKQFTESKAPKTDQQFAAVVAYYYRFQAPANERKESIGVKDLLEAVRLVERKRPPVPLATLTNAKNKGYLDKVGRAKFQINSVGENLVAMTLPGRDQETPTTRKTRKTAKKKRRKAATKRRRKVTK
jgi:hypothetical protein